MPKIYFIDNGLRNFATKNFSQFEDQSQKGSLLENFVFSSLLKSFSGTINFWRTKLKKEVDFILKDYFGNTMPVEVKASELKKELITPGLINFIHQYKIKKVYFINLKLEKKINKNGAKINFILPFRKIR